MDLFIRAGGIVILNTRRAEGVSGVGKGWEVRKDPLEPEPSTPPFLLRCDHPGSLFSWKRWTRPLGSEARG